MTHDIRIDLISDTSTRPTDGMRAAMAAATVGDEQRREDPTTTALCTRVAEMLGKEAAVFLPSGIMSNLIAIVSHCRPGDDIICDSTAHIIASESGGPAIVGGVSITPVETKLGIFDADAVKARLRPPRSKSPQSRLLHIEQTANRGGGAVWPLETITEAAAVAKDAGLSVHMDGARLLNAVAASNIDARDYAAPCDSVWIDLSKGLGCPVGSVLAGSAEFIETAWVWKSRLGGSMRQSGVLAAAGLYALDNHVDRLVDDHANAATFAKMIAEIPGVRLDPEPQTNLVFFDVSSTGMTAQDIAAALQPYGVRIGAENATRMRAVTHLDVDADGIAEAAKAVAAVIGAAA